MTLQECKNLVAQQYGYDKWEPKIYENGASMVESMYDQVIMLFIGCQKFKDGYGYCQDDCYFATSGLRTCQERKKTEAVPEKEPDAQSQKSQP